MEYDKRLLLDWLLKGSFAVDAKCPGDVIKEGRFGCERAGSEACTECWCEALGKILAPSEEETK